MPKLGFNNQSKNRLKDEQKAEWERLFYVAYTRASSILILPQYVGTDDNWFGFRNKSLNGILNDDSAKQFIMDNSIFTEMDWDKAMKEILENQKTIESEKPLEENHFKIGSNQKNYKHSYSSLSKGNEENEEDITEIEQSKVESENADLSIKFIDTAGIQVPCKYTIIKDSQEDEEDRYPRGTKLGSAVHKVFEELVFSEADIWRSNGKLDSLIRECFDKHNLHIDETDSKGWLSTTSSFVWNTMNAHLPLADGGCFSLKSIQEEEKKPEIEFNFNMDDKLINYCNGFMDLLFKRGTGDNARFFILDWKSDKLDSIDDYWKDDSLKSKVDMEYSVQRVLYSYCLIKWLSQIYEDSEENVFKNHFGGVYYVFFRGCKEGTGNGIYAHTWKTWQDLSKSYSNVVNRMKGRRGGNCR